jgi:acyl-CoA synthetase (AMP-forming)/AMP-acid ligase II
MPSSLHDAIHTIPDAIAFHAERTPDAAALLAPGWEPATYRELAQTVNDLADELRARGLGRDDGIALIFPDGPELCAALLAAITVGIAVPFVWPSPPGEFAAVLANPRVRAMVACEDSVELIAEAAHGTPVMVLRAGSSGRLGDLRLGGDSLDSPAAKDLPDPEDIALILHSSGTTGRPKLTPRLHRGALASARAIIAARAVTAADRCLSLAPLAFSQGFNSLAYTVLAGSSLIVVPRPDVDAMPVWVETYRPTFISTSPTVLLALDAGAGALWDTVRQSPLRSIHCTAGPLAPDDLLRLEAKFGVPILNGYGLSEVPAIAGEREPRNAPTPGEDLIPWCEVRIVDERGEPAHPGQPGEIVVRGPTLFPGYLDDPEANAAAFLPDGWFRTGDLGLLDNAGCLRVIGRRTEIVNRGGELLSPREVDDALLAHPAVAAAAIFGVPDDRLGEDIVAAVVLKPNGTASPRELRAWLLDRLRSSKVPRRIWFVVDLPRTPTGKVRRGELARRWHEEHA